MTQIELSADSIRKREKLEHLRKEYAQLCAEREEMISFEKESLYTLYLNLVGHANYEVFCLSVEVSALKLKVQLAQAAFNRSEKPNLAEIEKTVKKQLEHYYEQIAQQARNLEIAKTSTPIAHEQSRELKELYRLLVKRLHPDLHPEQEDRFNDLFLQVQTAYRTLDLDFLRQVVLKLEMDEIDLKELSAPNTEQFIERLEKQIEELSKNIKELNATFPFNYREKLSDRNWVEEEKKQLHERKKQLEREKQIYVERLELLTE